MKLLIFNFSFLILFSGCGIYKNYTRPAVETDGLYGEEYAADTVSFGSLIWSEVFTDPHLQKLIQTGLDNNTDLRIAYLKITEAQASLRSAKLSYLPSFNLTPSGSVSSFDGTKASKSYDLPLTASWELDIFGKLTNAKKQELVALEQSEAYRQAVQSQLVANIANAYYTLLMLDSQLEISRQTLKNWEENIRATRALKDAGQTNQAAVAQAEANKLGVEASVNDLQLQIREVENTLCSLLAQSPQDIQREKLEAQSLPNELSIGIPLQLLSNRQVCAEINLKCFIGIPLQLLSNRPDVMQAEASLKQAFYYTNEARSHFYPSITLSGNIGWTNSGGGMISNPGALLWETIGSLTQPIFNKGRNRARLNIAKAQQEQAQLTFQQTLLDAGIEVNNALTAWQNARQKVNIYENQVKQLEQAVTSTRLLMTHSNTTSYLEVLTAQQSLLSAQLNQVANRFGEIQSIINLYTALGGGRHAIVFP